MLQKVLERLQPHTSNEDVPWAAFSEPSKPSTCEAQVIFEEAQQIVESMRFPPALREAMRTAMAEVGAKDGEERLSKLLLAVKKSIQKDLLKEI